MANAKSLKNIQTTLFELKATLANDEIIRRLLFNDGPDALTVNYIPSVNDIIGKEPEEMDYITLFPVMEKGVIEYNKNTFIMIGLPVIDTDLSETKNIYAGYTITVITDKKHYLLDNQKVRLLELSNRVIELIDNKKFSIAGKLEIVQVEEVIFDHPIYGYNIKIMGADQGEGDDF